MAEYGISRATVSNWVRSYREECQNNDEKKSQLEMMEELRHLRREKSELEKENSFLNVKAGYLAQKSHCCQRIQALYHDSHGVMGHRKMKAFLQREGISLSKTTVHKYTNRELQLHSICR